jgi:cell division protein FtsI (penicillin-binding protein 3)
MLESQGRINRKAKVILLSFFLWMGVVVTRVYYLQIVKHDELLQKANKQYDRTYLFRPERGSIYDRYHRLLVGNIEKNSVFVDPGLVRDTSHLSKTLADILEIEKKHLSNKIASEKNFVWVKRKISPEKAKRIKDMGLAGVGLTKEEERVYPEKDLAAHILGFVGMDQQGLAGIEFFYDELLGEKSFRQKEQHDAFGRRLYLREELLQALPNGKDIVLSIDRTIQYIVEKELRLQVHRLKANAGVAIIMDPSTGELLALAVQPSFNPSCYNDYTPKKRRNKAISDIYEPGSTFKLIPLSAVIEESLVSPEDKFYCGNGIAHFGRMVIHDIHPYGWLSLRDVISLSSNIGTIQLSQKLGNNHFYQYIKKFGFGTKTGIDLPGESSGIFRSLGNWSKSSLPAITIGHEIGVTPIQLLRAYAAIANGGHLVKPTIVREIIEKGQPKEAFSSWEPRKILSNATCEKVTSILIQAVDKGTGKKASLLNYTVAGKTGTAQKYDPNIGSYSNKRFIASFVGFVPAHRAKMIILVMIDEPHKEIWGGTAAAPVFKEIAKQVLRYMAVPPDKGKSLKIAETRIQ